MTSFFTFAASISVATAISGTPVHGQVVGESVSAAGVSGSQDDTGEDSVPGGEEARLGGPHVARPDRRRHESAEMLVRTGVVVPEAEGV